MGRLLGRLALITINDYPLHIPSENGKRHRSSTTQPQGPPWRGRATVATFSENWPNLTGSQDTERCSRLGRWRLSFAKTLDQLIESLKLVVLSRQPIRARLVLPPLFPVILG